MFNDRSGTESLFIYKVEIFCLRVRVMFRVGVRVMVAVRVSVTVNAFNLRTLNTDISEMEASVYVDR